MPVPGAYWVTSKSFSAVSVSLSENGVGRGLHQGKRAIICIRVSTVMAVPLDKRSCSGPERRLTKNSGACVWAIGSSCLGRKPARSFPLLLGLALL